MNRADRVVEIGADAVHLVDEADARHAVFVGLAPDGFRLRLHAGDGVKQRNGAVEHAQTALHLGRKIDVAGRIDDVDLIVAPEAGGGGGGDRNAALLLLLHVVHRRRAFVHLSHPMQTAGVIENALGRGRLAGIDVSRDTDIAILFQTYGTGHNASQ